METGTPGHRCRGMAAGSARTGVTPRCFHLQGDVGDPVALVIADSRALAEDAAALVEVVYEELDPVVTMADAMAAAPIHPGTESNVASEIGDEEQFFGGISQKPGRMYFAVAIAPTEDEGRLTIDRKVLSDLAIREPEAFAAIVATSKTALEQAAA